MSYRNTLILSAAQALSSSAGSLLVLVGGVIGVDLAPTPELATLPITLLVIGLALATLPAGLIAQRTGRKRGFLGGALLAALAALLAAYAISAGSFTLFCLAALLIGGDMAFVQQYRFAAVESTPDEKSGLAVSFVLFGSLLSGFIGPEIGKRGKDWLAYGEYTGSFVALAGLFLVVIALLFWLQDVRPVETAEQGPARPLRAIVRQPDYLIALLASVVAFGAMTFLMTATPVQMNHFLGHSVEQSGLVIQSHVIAMYLPSLFTGLLIARLGLTLTMSSGVLLLLLAVAANLAGQDVPHFWIGLVLLGAGWNFLFVSGTVLLSQTYRPAERFKAQAFNDFWVFGTQAAASLSAGVVLFQAGWNTLLLLTLPVLGAMAVLVFLFHRRTARRAEAVVVR